MERAALDADLECVPSGPIPGSDQLVITKVIDALAAEAPWAAVPVPRVSSENADSTEFVDMPSLYRELYGLTSEECEQPEVLPHLPIAPRGFTTP